MGKENLADLGAPVETRNEADHVAKCRAILDRTSHSRAEVSWPDIETRDEASRLSGIRIKPGCSTCHFQIIDYLRKQVGLHPLNKEVMPGEYRRRMNICRGNERKGIPRCEHLAWPGLNCGKCLCFIDIKGRMKNQQCPIGKWERK